MDKPPHKKSSGAANVKEDIEDPPMMEPNPHGQKCVEEPAKRRGGGSICDCARIEQNFPNFP